MTDIHDTEGTEAEIGGQPIVEPGGAEDLVEELIEIMTSAKSMPLSSSAIVTRDEVLDLLEAIRDELPEELRRARRLLKDHEELLAAARREAADIVSDGRVAGFEIVLDRTLKTVRAGRERLASVPPPQPQPGDQTTDELGDDAWLAGEGFFDQDLE